MTTILHGLCRSIMGQFKIIKIYSSFSFMVPAELLGLGLGVGLSGSYISSSARPPYLSFPRYSSVPFILRHRHCSNAPAQSLTLQKVTG